MKLNINWKVYTRLFFLGLFGSVMASPYLFFILNENQKLRVTWLEVIFNQIAQAFITLIPILLIGLMLARRIGFHLAFLENWKKNKIKLLPYLKQTLITSILLVIFILTANFLLYQLGIKPESILKSTPSLVIRLLVSFYTGINEEIIFRLFTTSFLIWLITKIRFQKDYKSYFNIWFGIVMSSIIFALANFSFPSSINQLNYSLILRSLILNGIPAVVYGYLYWKRGLEAAMFTHFFVTFFLQLI